MLILGCCYCVLGWKIDGRLYNLKKDVSVQDSKHRKTLGEVSVYGICFVCGILY